MEPILKPKRTNATAKKAMELVHRKRITLKEAWEEVRRPNTTKSTPAPETQKKSRVIIKRT